MNQDSNDFISEFSEEPLQRTSFLTVLCVLTFIGSGLTILMSLLLLLTSGSIDQIANTPEFEAQLYDAYSGMMQESEIDKLIDMLYLMFEKMFPVSLIMLIAAALRFSGAVMMYKLNKVGFHLYTSGQILRFALPVLVGLSSVFYPDFGSIFTSAALPIGFVVMYAINMKIIKTK